MEILVRRKGSRKWEKVGEQKFVGEAALQKILYESPEIIPIEELGEDLRRPRLFVKEAGLPGSGNTDLIGIDENGDITIIECKLAANTDIRRKVIGQVYEYAAYLWQMPFEEFDRLCAKAEKWGDKSLTAMMREIMQESGEPWVEEGFRQNLSSTLSSGDFRLVIAVNELNDELMRIVEFLDSRRDRAPTIYVLEMKQFETSELQMLVPELIGPPPVKPKKEPMSEEKLIGESSDRCRQLYFGLKNLARMEIFDRSSFTPRGYGFRYRDQGNLLVLFPDYVQMWFGPGYPTDFRIGKDADKEFWGGISQITAFKDKMDRKNPETSVDNTWSKDEVDSFLAALKQLGLRLG